MRMLIPPIDDDDGRPASPSMSTSTPTAPTPDCADAAAQTTTMMPGGIERQTRQRIPGLRGYITIGGTVVASLYRIYAVPTPPRGGIISPRYSPCTPSSERGECARVRRGETNRSTRHESIDVHWVNHGGGTRCARDR